MNYIVQGSYVNGVTKSSIQRVQNLKDTNNMAELARSMNVEDINRVTGYDPEGAKYKEQKYPTTDTTSSYTSFTYWNDTSWIPLESEKEK